MYKVSTSLWIPFQRYGLEEAIRMIAEAGFDAYDLTMCEIFGREKDPFGGDDWLEVAHRLRQYADRLGIPCNQAHAPYPTSRGDETDEQIFESVVKSMEIASVLGAKIIVVHPNQHLYYLENAERLKELNMAFYRRLEPYCEKFNIKVALENMWQRYSDFESRIVESTCSRVEEFCDYLDTLDSPWFVACLDLGHVVLAGENLTKMIHGLGPRLQALHIHDNDTHNDTHTLPFHSKIDFEKVTQALADIGYSGDLTLEADRFMASIPASQQEAHQLALEYMCRTTRVLGEMIEQKKAEVEKLG